MSSIRLLPLFIAILFISEVIGFFIIKRLVKNKKWYFVWWGVTILLFVGLFWTRAYASNYVRNWYVNLFMIVLLTKFIAGLFFLILEGIRLTRNNKRQPEVNESRREFNSKLAVGLAAIPFTTLNWGIFKTAFNFQVFHQRIRLKNLPKTFEGFKILQLSDIHTGSLQSHYQLRKAIDMAMEQSPDIICFTGDLVNNRTDEVFPYIEDLKRLSAPYGVLSILGNHDYGDYETWSSPEEKQANMDQMIQVHKDLGWNLLLNQHVVIEKEKEQLVFIGVENWGASYKFPKYGRLKEAYEGIEKEACKILLSHDPSHFDAEVTDDFKDIQLTLSGHTHGFQFGVEIPGYVKWSPSQYIYPHWAGLYRIDEQQLYVNRGLGCLGYMGRIGIRPEITVITLVSE